MSTYKTGIINPIFNNNIKTKTMKTINENQIEFTRIDNDTNGNPRFVCHFLAFINDKDREIANNNKADIFSINTLYSIALKKSRQLGGKKFHNKQYGGGIVFQMYSGQTTEMSNLINEIKNS